jgi:hypothetical protein
MRFKELIIGDKRITDQKRILEILDKGGFNWLIDSEIEDVQIEIKKETIIWHSGNFYSGTWQYGIFKSGNFYGKFENGIFEGGNFEGIGVSGIGITK